MRTRVNELHKFAYLKTIDAYNFHVNRYNAWMNYFALFTGAAFAGLTSMIKDINSINFIHIVIAIIGLAASMCWWMSHTGYYAWLKSWTYILQKREHNYLRRYTDVYRYIEPGLNADEISNAKTLPKFISTQKIMGFFIQIVLIGWLVVIGYLLLKIQYRNCKITFETFEVVPYILIGIILYLIAYIVVNYTSSTLFSSNVKHMIRKP